MNRRSLGFGLGIASAAILPSLLAYASTPDRRLGLGLACPPFGWPLVMIVHLVASLPAGLIAAAGLVRSVAPERRRGLIPVGIMAGLAATLAVTSQGENIAWVLELCDPGFAARGFARAVLAFLMVLPWLVVEALRDGPEPRIVASPAAILVGATLALLPPLVYESKVIENRSIDLRASLGTGRLTKAKAVMVGLSDLGSPRGLAGTSPTQALRKLEIRIDAADRDVSHGLIATASPAERLERAFRLIQLERLDQAESLLRPLSGASPDAALLLGAIYRDQARWPESERAYRQALAGLIPGVIEDRVTQERIATAFDGLAEAARSGGHPELAERSYRQASRQLPARAGYFALQLGRHYLDGGRPQAAITHLRQAIQFDPTLETQVRPLIRQVEVSTPACLLRSSFRRPE